MGQHSGRTARRDDGLTVIPFGAPELELWVIHIPGRSSSIPIEERIRNVSDAIEFADKNYPLKNSDSPLQSEVNVAADVRIAIATPIYEEES